MRRGKAGKRAVPLPTPLNEFEETFALHCRAHQLPAFVRQFRYVPDRQLNADFAWLPYRVLVEVQGGIWRMDRFVCPNGTVVKRPTGAHSRPANIERDIEKAQMAVELGWWLVPITTAQVMNGKGIEIVKRVLYAKGWRNELVSQA